MTLGLKRLSSLVHSLVDHFNSVLLITLRGEAEGLRNNINPLGSVNLTANLRTVERVSTALEDVAHDVVPVDEPVHGVPNTTEGERVELNGTSRVNETSLWVADKVQVERPPDANGLDKADVLTVALNDLRKLSIRGSVPVEVVVALCNGEDCGLRVGGTVNVNLLPVRLPRDWDTVDLTGGETNPLVASELEDHGEGLRVVACNVVRAVTDDDVLVVVNPLDDVLVTLLRKALSDACLVHCYAPLLEDRLEGAQPDWDGSAVEE